MDRPNGGNDEKVKRLQLPLNIDLFGWDYTMMSYVAQRYEKAGIYLGSWRRREPPAVP